MEPNPVITRIVPISPLQSYFFVKMNPLTWKCNLIDESLSFGEKLNLLRGVTKRGAMQYCRKYKGEIVIAHTNTRDFTNVAHSDWHTDNAHHDVAHKDFTDHHNHDGA